jgi:DNA-binding SARP family transcriptional activator
VLEFRILGPLEVLDGDRPVRLGGPKQRATLAILLLSANRVVSVERLADDLYAGAPPVTAVTQVQRQVSELRKVLGAETIETRAPGYVLHVDADRIDLDRFERWTHDAAQALERNDPPTAADLLRRALELWRGAPLADLTYESFAQTAIARLDELRLAALEHRFEAELALGHHGEILPELEALVWDQPLRERPRSQLMLALYRAGRQAESLEVYRKGRETLVEELGIEPSTALGELEQRILRHDPSLDLPQTQPVHAVASDRTLLVVPAGDDRLDALLSVAEPLATLPDRSLILARLVDEEGKVAPAAAVLAARRTSLAAPARTAAFTSLEPARDVVRLARSYDVELVLLDAAESLVGDVPGELAAVVEHSPADVAVLSGAAIDWQHGDGVFVPFGGSDGDWGALEIGAWLASATSSRLRLVGTSADPSRGRRDASRLLADASLAVQRVVGVEAEPMLVELSEKALTAAVAGATAVVSELPARWRAEGLGGPRQALIRRGVPPVLLVHRGMRPGGLSPRDSWTRFSWTLQP